MADEARALPAIDERSVPFFEAAERGVLALQRCEACGAYLHPGRGRCSACGDTRLAWVESSGEADSRWSGPGSATRRGNQRCRAGAA